jgi:methylated-DNA-[protein]-cysteine S-methyltransferase
MNTYYIDSFFTPTGAFSVAVDDTGALVATAFGDRKSLRSRLKCQCHLIDDTFKTRGAREQVQEYFSGQRASFELRLAPAGTKFQQRVWTALQRIPFGKTRSYGELAASLKKPGAARAVGRANATNPICLIIPCHRVIGADGSLTGFAFGEGIKRKLLAHEGAARAVAA